MSSRNPGAMAQDWEPVVLHKARPKAQDLRHPKAVNQALRAWRSGPNDKKIRCRVEQEAWGDGPEREEAGRGSRAGGSGASTVRGKAGNTEGSDFEEDEPSRAG
ncbi:Transcription factor MBF1 [Abeliophyllum distichum]|uniref:Transcription factor MBF1 n=1 Tax=Abeliophyllum distichum TaxID=126358 RepID=A0ABD1VA48_9LAMI